MPNTIHLHPLDLGGVQFLPQEGTPKFGRAFASQKFVPCLACGKPNWGQLFWPTEFCPTVL